MLNVYRSFTACLSPVARLWLLKRLRAGKELRHRLAERWGAPSLERPDAKPLIWLHAASVGEAQSALILIETILKKYPEGRFVVTSGTLTSAQMMERKLPRPHAVHQFVPLDIAGWVNRFIDHWQPDLALWLESEIWPNMITNLQARQIPLILINARLSDTSRRNWNTLGSLSRSVFGCFDLVLCQSEKDTQAFLALGAPEVKAPGNLKYSAAPLPVCEDARQELEASLSKRPVWLYASTHEGEEDLACSIHRQLKDDFPNLLTIIVPRHPERGEDIKKLCEKHELAVVQRSINTSLPTPQTDIYLADTLGELGLFYSLSPLACIGRSFSDDGGGGHNPLEAMPLNCAVLFGPNVQNLHEIYKDIEAAKAGLKMYDKENLARTLKMLLKDHRQMKALQQAGLKYAQARSGVLDDIMADISPYIEKAAA